MSLVDKDSNVDRILEMDEDDLVKCIEFKVDVEEGWF